MKPATPEELDEIRKLLAERYPNEPCFNHEVKVQKLQGVGDVVAKITGFFGIKPCNGCKKRQRALNKWMPFGE